MKVKLKKPVERGSVPQEWYDRLGCDHSHHDTGFPGGIEVDISIANPGYGITQSQVCIPALNEALGNSRVQFHGTSQDDPFGLSGDPRARAATPDEQVLQLATQLLEGKGPVTHYWNEGDQVLALGAGRTHLGKLLGTAVGEPPWARGFARLLERSAFAGWLTEGGSLSPLGAVRSAVVASVEGCKRVLEAAARLRAKAEACGGGDSAPRGVSGRTRAESELLKATLSRKMIFRGNPVLGLVLREISDAPLLALEPAPGDRMDAICSLGAGRWARVQVESLKDKARPLVVSLVSGELGDAVSALVIRADGGDLRLWAEVGCAPALEGVLPPGPRRRLAAAQAIVETDDDDGDDEDGNPNWPSTTGNPSGGGRGNNPPSK